MDEPSYADKTRGLAFLAAHFAFSLLIQLELYALDIRLIDDGALSAVWFIFTFPFLQLEHLAVAALPAILAALCWRQRMLRWLPQLMLVLLNGWLILDQATFEILFDHINLSMNDDSIGAVPAMLPSLRDSLLVALDGTFVFNVVVCVLLSLWVQLPNPLESDACFAVHFGYMHNFHFAVACAGGQGKCLSHLHGRLFSADNAKATC